MDLGLSHNQKEPSFKDHGCLSLRKSTYEKQSSSRTPGPIYSPNVSSSSTKKNKIRSITFGSGPARFDSVDSRVNSPGPQEYDPNGQDMKITAAGMLKILLVTVIWRIVGGPFSPWSRSIFGWLMDVKYRMYVGIGTKLKRY